ncbi:MAG: glycosyltransferase family 2 protein [Haliscomenobacter sp.]|nr:glycosyltransferase family 2 protein [Haliscomenobacter sp.]
MARVSIIIPTYNYSQFIIRALHSVFEKTYNDFEVIIADDGSTDNTRTLVEQFDKSIVYYAFQPNRGLSSTRNLALSKASGEFVAYLDADDMWYPDKLVRQIAFLDAHPECALT